MKPEKGDIFLGQDGEWYKIVNVLHNGDFTRYLGHSIRSGVNKTKAWKRKVSKK